MSSQPRRMIRQLRGLTSRQRHAFAASFLGWALDSFDFFILVFCVSAIAADFHARTSAVFEALFLTLAFRPVGAFLFGALADRYGRRPALMLNIACYSVLELSCAFAGSLHSLLWLRALFGIAMGGEWGVGAALAFETLPTEGRGFFSGILQEGYAIGYLAAAAMYALLFPHFQHMHWLGHTIGWRGMFAVGSVPALLVLYIGLKVEESPVWKAAQETRRTATPSTQAQKKTALADGIRKYTLRFLYLILLMTGFNAFAHGTQDVYPTFLQHDHHFPVQLTGSVAIIYTIGALFGGIFFGTLSERFGRKRTILAAVALTIPIIPIYALSHSLVTIAVGAFLMQFMVQGAWGVIPAWLTELSPGPVRATFPGLAYQLGNLITSGDAVIQAKAAERYGGFGRILAVTVLLVACFLAIVVALGKESQGTELTV